MLECAANLACVGAEPLGTTNNLNFGNPEKPHIAWQLAEAVARPGRGLSRVVRPDRRRQRLAVQRGHERPDLPHAGDRHGRSPARRAPRAGRLGFLRAGERIALVGPFAPSPAASELSKLLGQPLPYGLAEIDLPPPASALAAVREAVRAGVLSSAHDVAEGGLAVALAECCIAGRIGARVGLGDGHWEALGPPGGDAAAWSERSAETLLFGEGSGGILVSGPEAGLRALGEPSRRADLGEVAGQSLDVSTTAPRARRRVQELAAVHAGGLAGCFR